MKFVACIMAGNCEKYVKLCIDAVKPYVDKVIVCYDSSSKDETLYVLQEYEDIIIISRPYEHDINCKTSNGDQRNFYLDYLKENFMGDWVLCLDADEVVDENIKYFKEHMEELEAQNIWLISPKMEHFIGDFSHVDSIQKEHWVLNRLFKVHNELFYPRTEHPVLQTTKEVNLAKVDSFIIYHLAYCREMFYIRDRYLNHLAKSEMHTKDFLQDWTYAHYTGKYPKRDFDIHNLPKVMKDYFLIDDDYWYFRERGLEVKHFLDAIDWKNLIVYTPDQSCEIIEFGCGVGPRIYAMTKVGIFAKGVELSEYAVKHKMEEDIVQGDVLSYRDDRTFWDMVVAYDLLEHIDEKDLDKAIATLKYHTHKYILVSVPMIGDPNLMRDKTHKVFWTREQWENKLKENGLKIIETPEHWQYRKQLILCEVIR